MGETNHHQCETLSVFKKDEAKYENETIRKLIKDINNDLQVPGKWTAEAVQKLQGDINFIEKEYNTIPQLVAAYEQFYPELKESGSKYCTAERQSTSIKEWVDNSNLSQQIKDAITDLRNNNYRDDADEDFNNPPAHPKTILDKAEKEFNSIKNCHEQRKAEEELITNIYTKAKDFQKTIEKWLGDLKTVYDKANDFNMKKKYRALYAVYLEASQVWKKITRLSSTSGPQDAAWFQKDLTGKLKKSLIAKHELFCWHDDLLKKQNALDKANTDYKTFTSNRQQDFLREAEDVPPKSSAPPQTPPKQEPTQTPYSA